MKLKIKYILYLLLLCSFALFFGGCAYTLSPVQGILYTNVDKPVAYSSAKQNKSYQVLGEVEARSSASSILGIVAIGNAGSNEAHSKAFSQIPGTEGLVDITIDQNFNSFLGLYASTTTILRAKAVKWIYKEKTISIRGKADSTSISYISQIPSSTTQVGINFDKITQFFTQGDLNHNINISLSDLAGEPGGVGFRLGYKMRRTGFKFTFNPAISFGSVKKDLSAGKKIKYNVIPIELNVTANSEFFNQVFSNLNPEVRPYIEGGLVYYIWKESDTNSNGDSWEGGWDYFELGLNFGLGVEYDIKPNLAVQGSIKKYIVFFGKDFDFWNYQVGLTFLSK